MGDVLFWAEGMAVARRVLTSLPCVLRLFCTSPRPVSIVRYYRVERMDTKPPDIRAGPPRFLLSREKDVEEYCRQGQKKKRTLRSRRVR